MNHLDFCFCMCLSLSLSLSREPAHRFISLLAFGTCGATPERSVPSAPRSSWFSRTVVTGSTTLLSWTIARFFPCILGLVRPLVQRACMAPTQPWYFGQLAYRPHARLLLVVLLLYTESGSLGDYINIFVYHRFDGTVRYQSLRSLSTSF